MAFGELLARTADADLIAVRIGAGCTSKELEAKASELAAGSPVRVRAEASADGSATKALLELVTNDPEVGAVALGSTHRAGLGRVMPGGVAAHLLNAAPVRGRRRAAGLCEAARAGVAARRPRLRRLARGKAAARVAAGLAKLAATGLRAFGVREPVGGWMLPGAEATSGGTVAYRESLEDELNQLLDDLPSSVGGQKLILAGDPATTLLDQGSRPPT